MPVRNQNRKNVSALREQYFLAASANSLVDNELLCSAGKLLPWPAHHGGSVTKAFCFWALGHGFDHGCVGYISDGGEK